MDRIKKRDKKLLHINRRILNNESIENKDLYYLNIMQDKYLEMFIGEKIFNVIHIKDEDNELAVINTVMCYFNKQESFVESEEGVTI